MSWPQIHYNNHQYSKEAPFTFLQQLSMQYHSPSHLIHDHGATLLFSFHVALSNQSNQQFGLNFLNSNHVPTAGTLHIIFVEAPNELFMQKTIRSHAPLVFEQGVDSNNDNCQFYVLAMFNLSK
jgi:hypothetical protein